MRYVARLTAALAQWLPPFWSLTQVRGEGTDAASRAW